MRNFKNVILLILSILLLNSCATVFLPSNQNVTIQTASKDAKIYVDNEKFGEGRSATNKIEKGRVNNVAIVYGEEYVQKNDVLIPERKKSPGYYVCQALNVPFCLFGYGIYAVYIDTQITKSHSFPKVNSYKSKPQLLPIRGDDSKYVYLSNISLDIKDTEEKLLWHTGNIKINLKTAIAEAESESIQAKQEQDKYEAKNKKKKKNKEYLVDDQKDIKFEDVVFTEKLQQVLYTGGFMDTINNVFIDNNNTLIIEGKISKIDFFKIAPFKSVFSSNIYIARTDLKWYIKNTYGEIIDSVADLAFSENFAYEEDIMKKTIGSSVTQSFYNLIEKNVFKENFKIETNFSSKLEITKLNKPDSIIKDKRDAIEASVIIKTKNGHGSGFAITNDGYIITNYHILVDRKKGARVDDIIVIDSDGNEMKGILVKVNKFRDVALLKVDKEFSKVFYCSDKKSFRMMDDVYTIGAPKSITLGQSISIGLISNERKVNNNDLIQLNMSVNSGNSGGPIFDGNGILHGVVVSKLVGKNIEGVSFAVPSYKLAEYLNFQF